MPTKLRATNQKIGKIGETLAANYLISHGYTVLAKNWRTKFGEIDLIIKKGPTIAAVEVKTRTSVINGSPLEAITPRKRQRLRKLLKLWLIKNQKVRALPRIDAIAVLLSPIDKPKITHVKAIL